MEPLRVGQIAAALNLRLLQGSQEAVITGVAIDSRRVEAGQLFFALPGTRTDGHQFVEDALQRGAAAAVVSRPVAAAAEWTLLLAPDTLQALQDLAAYYRSLFTLPVVAVTGSTGKTTTKDLIAAVLGAGRRVVKTEGNQNNEIGLPLTLLRLEKTCGAAVVEMAMRLPGEIASLCRICRPLIGVITNIGITHLERLGSQAAIAEAKGELLEALPPEGCAVLNGDDPWQLELARKCRCDVLWYGQSEGAAVRAGGIKMDGLQGSSFTLATPLGESPCLLPLPGAHNVSNALAAAAVGHRLGMQPEEIARGLGAACLTGMRLEVKAGIRGSTLIDDTYNASPDSVMAALRLLAGVPGGRQVAVLGEMYELGAAAASYHRTVGAGAASLGIDHLCAVGELAREIVRGAREAGMPEGRISFFPDNRTAAAWLAELIAPGDVVLLKASRGAHMEEIVALLRSEESGS
jgi:UDP-N-acetylmuramoyl-tripeptide--D-alanyl-D-alanine ligase